MVLPYIYIWIHIRNLCCAWSKMTDDILREQRTITEVHVKFRNVSKKLMKICRKFNNANHDLLIINGYVVSAQVEGQFNIT